MDTKEEFIRSTIRQLQRVAAMYSLVEQLPLHVEGCGEVTTREAHMIEAVGECGELNITALADRFGVTKSAASQMTAKLVMKGFIDKKQAPHSNKEYLLSLTEAGIRVFNAHEQVHGKDLAHLIDHLSAFPLSQIATLSVLLEAIGAVMEERLALTAKK